MTVCFARENGCWAGGGAGGPGPNGHKPDCERVADLLAYEELHTTHEEPENQ